MQSHDEEGSPDRSDPRQVHEPIYLCPDCRSRDVELCFPVWIPANDRDDRRRWHLDDEAHPEKDSDKGWCPRCRQSVLVRRML